MAKWKDFEGLKNIKDPYKYKVAENLIINELGGISDGYMLSHAGTGESGWSFGAHQYDLSVNKEGREIIKQILDNQYGEKFYLTIEADLIKSKDIHSLDKDTIIKINQALSSDFGKDLINKDFIQEVNKVCSHIERVENKLGIALTVGEKLMLVDYHNQYNLLINSSSSASLINKMQKSIEKTGDISKEDLKSLFQETKYYKENSVQKNRVEKTYQNAVKLDNKINISTEAQGIKDLKELSLDLIKEFEQNKEEKIKTLEEIFEDINSKETLEEIFEDINSKETLEEKLETLKEIEISNLLENFYSKQLIKQYQDKVIENQGKEVSSLDFINMEIKQEEKRYLNFEALSTNQNNNSQIQTMS